MGEKRIKGQAYWKLRGLVEKSDEALKEYKEFQEAYCKKNGKYPDQVNFGTGRIVDAFHQDKTIARMSPEDMAASRAMLEKVTSAQDAIEAERVRLAKALKTWPDCISATTGKVDDLDVEELDPDAEDADEAPADKVLPGPDSSSEAASS